MRYITRPLIVAVLLAAFVRTLPAQTAPATPDSSARARDASRSTRIPLLEISGFLVALSVYDRIAYANQMQDGKKVYSATLATTWDHLIHQHWVHDQDPFNINQFAHPYQGAFMYGLSRSTGHGFWLSLAHSNAGSFIWKMAGETDPPSINDMITTGQAGSLLGEALYRMADLVLHDNPDGRDHPWRNRLADAISIPTAINRRFLGDTYRRLLPDSAPATSWQVRLGASLDAVAQDAASPGTLLRRDATAELWMSYGLPGKPGYNYRRPLDYFDMQLSLLFNASNPIENVLLRGLLLGGKTSNTGKSRGIWGLYGSYDYISPHLFRVSSTAASLGTTQQLWLTPNVAMQSTLLGGVGYGAAGSTKTIASTPLNATIRDYHFGVTPQALATTRLIFGDRAMIDVAAREYYVSGFGSDDTRGSETIFRGSLGLNLRVSGGHTIGARFVQSHRDARYGKAANTTASEGTVTVAYSFLGNNHFSAVAW